MSPADRWDRVEALFGTLFERSVEERQRALDAVQDADLRAEVGALLSTHQALTSGHGGFLEGLDSVRANALLERSPPSGEPSTIGRYRILRRLARGGMGVVYLAHDPLLERRVALKLLPPYLNADPTAVRRLGDEARAASALDNPHIETVYEIGEADDGRVFISMAYYEGETLRERIGRGPMEVPEVIELGIQLARGLGAAHRSGIVHRDIKPENILLTRDGVLKIVDFGIAKVVREGLASAGLPLGTAAYMSPEQTRGEALDHRTDLWSAGVVLYEMLAARRPFGGTGEALIHAIRNDSPRPIPDLRHEVPASVAAAVERCLAKDPEMRLDAADALTTALRGGATRSVSETNATAPGSVAFESAAPRSRGRRAWIVATVGVAALGLAGFLLRSDRKVATPVAVGETVPGIAVLPFEVRGEGLDIWREGMVDLLSINLEGTAELRAIDSRTVLAGWREALGEGTAAGLDQALEVARRADARYAVIGTVVSTGAGMRLGARIYSVEDGSNLASLRVEGSPDSLFTLVDRLSIDILAAIWQGEERPREDVDLTRITTTSLPALKAYLEGESLLRRADFAGAAAAYERAIAADSTFAFALFHAGLTHGWLGDQPHQNESYRRALRHAASLPEREALLLRAVVDYSTGISDLPTVIGRLREVTQKYPDDPDAWYFLADAFFHAGEGPLFRQDESETAFRKVVELDPGFAPGYVHLVNNAFILYADSGRAARLIETYERLAPQGDRTEENRIAFGLAFGDSARRSQAYAELDGLPTGRRQWLGAGFLDHPRFWTLRRVVLDHRPRAETPEDLLITAGLLETNLSQGRVRAALDVLEDPVMLPGVRAAGFYALHSKGVPAHGLNVGDALKLPETVTLPLDIQATAVTFHAGAYAGDEERWQDHAAAVGRLRAQADRHLADGDLASARFARGASLALQGQAMWRRGNALSALPLLVEGQRATTWVVSATRESLNRTIRRWLGELLLEMGRPGEAARYFESFWHDPWAAERLGPIYEQLGDRAKARDAYALVAFAWEDADPELQVRARVARAALQRLGASIKD